MTTGDPRPLRFYPAQLFEAETSVTPSKDFHPAHAVRVNNGFDGDPGH